MNILTFLIIIYLICMLIVYNLLIDKYHKEGLIMILCAPFVLIVLFINYIKESDSDFD